MKHRIWNKDRQYQDIQHFDLDAWIAEGWLTSEPPLEPELLDKPVMATEKTKNKN